MQYELRVPGGSYPNLKMEGVQMKEVLLRLWKEESGQDLTEYALLLVLVTLLAFASLQSLSTKINTVYDTAANDLNVTTTTT
jgi:Flp pilus assembly pilin Flp